MLVLQGSTVAVSPTDNQTNREWDKREKNVKIKVEISFPVIKYEPLEVSYVSLCSLFDTFL